MREITKSSWKFVLFLLMLQINDLFAMEFNEGTRNQFISKHRPVIVMGTNDGYINPTAASIMSIKGSTPDDKSIIVLYNELSAENAALLERLSDSSTKIVTRKIDENIKRRAEEFSTDWNILVQERIFYPEIFKELNADGEFLQKIGLEGPVNYFIHLDSDTLVLRNLFDIYGHFYLDKYFASVNLETVSCKRLEAYLNGYVEPTCISGGVVVWNLEALNRDGKFLSYYAKDMKNNNYIDEGFLNMCRELLDDQKRDKIVEKIRFIVDNPEKQEEVYRDNIVSDFFKNLSKISASTKMSERYLKLIENMATVPTALESVRRYVESDEKMPENASEKIVLEEDVMIEVEHDPIILPEKYNFVMKNIFPEIHVKQLYDEVWEFIDKDLKSYADVLRKHLDIPGLHDDLVNNFNDMVVMHFDVSLKPWSLEFKELAKTNPSLQKIIDIYEIFKEGISDPDSAADRSKRALDILKKINPEEELQKIQMNKQREKQKKSF